MLVRIPMPHRALFYQALFFRFFEFLSYFGAFRENNEEFLKTLELLSEGPTPPVTAMDL